MYAPHLLSTPLSRWVHEIARHTNPKTIHLCDGSEEERRNLEQALLLSGGLIPLDRSSHPRSFLHRSDPSDVARTEHLTFISTPDSQDAGPTNNWMSREDAEARVWPLLKGAMKDRAMYVVPYLMGPLGSPYSRAGIQLTDSAYVALNLRIMTRMGLDALEYIQSGGPFVRGIHSLGDLSPERRFIVHFPESMEIWSVGSGYGGNALLSKKCHALRIATRQAQNEGWLAEHMLLVGLTSPKGKKHYIAAAFPSACGKTNLAMLVPSLPGWKVDTVGDDIAWLHVGKDGRLWAINPENGMFGVAPGTSLKTNPNAMKSLTGDVLFTNVALRLGGRVWWEGMEPLGSEEVLEDWRGERWTPDSERPAAHPNARFTVALRQCPSATGTFDEPRGIPISAILFGGRQARLSPLVYEARNWAHGVYVGATMSSETTAAATGAVGILRRDPMAMLPFCGSNMGNYFTHWLRTGQRLTKPPKIFHVNWFRKDEQGRFLWPGFGENIRVLQWILERCEGNAPAQETPIGLVPPPGALNLRGMDLTPERQEQLFAIDSGAWLHEAEQSREFLRKFGERLPPRLLEENEVLSKRLREAIH